MNFIAKIQSNLLLAACSCERHFRATSTGRIRRRQVCRRSEPSATCLAAPIAGTQIGRRPEDALPAREHCD